MGRRVVRRDRRRFPFAAVIVFLLGIVPAWWAYSGLREWRVLSELQEQGLKSPARVESVRTEVSGRFPVDIVRYDFLPDGAVDRREGEERFRHDRFPGLNRYEFSRAFYGGTLAVLYDADDPDIHRLDVSIPTRLGRARGEGLLFGFITLGFAFGVVVLARRDLRQRTS